jgi:hypothetical protein
MSNERAPLLSDEDGARLYEGSGYIGDGFNIARDFYEAKITSGELMVAKTATKGNGASPWCCSECGLYLGRIDDPNFCPGCGAKIVEA